MSGTNLWRVVPALGITQIISWGTLYYAIAVLGESMQRDLGMGPVMLYGAFTVALVISGLAAPRIGRLIDRRGGSSVLMTGSVIAAAAFTVLATATGPASLIAGWLLAGFAMAAILYDAAFATLARIAGPSYRTAITALTLFGGFASTVFWPVSQYLLDAIGWRQTLAGYALLQILVCLPLHALFIPRLKLTQTAAAAPTAQPIPRRRPAQLHFLAAAFALAAFAFSALSVHLIAMLKTSGLTASQAVWIAALIGPMQVAGRIVEFTLGRGLRPTTVGALALALMLMALILLTLVRAPGAAAIAFAMAYGCSNGVITIARGIVPAQLFGLEGYGELLGWVARFVSAATAAAPLAVSLLLAAGIGYPGIQACLVGCLVLALACYARALSARSPQAA